MWVRGHPFPYCYKHSTGIDSTYKNHDPNDCGGCDRGRERHHQTHPASSLLIQTEPTTTTHYDDMGGENKILVEDQSSGDGAVRPISQPQKN